MVVSAVVVLVAGGGGVVDRGEDGAVVDVVDVLLLVEVVERSVVGGEEVVVGEEEAVEEVEVDGSEEVAVLDKRVLLGVVQNGDWVSAPSHVWPEAQQMDPHWKSPAAQTLAQPTLPVSEGQQKKAPLMTEHVSPAPPRGRERG